MSAEDEDEDEDRSLFDTLRSLLGEQRARDLAQELYGLGYYIRSRSAERDPFDFAKAPAGMSYQWVLAGEAAEAEAKGWAPVAQTRYEGFYAPIGYPGPIAMHGLMLMEREAAISEAARSAEVAKAHKNVDDWVARYGAMFSGGVKIGTSKETADRRVVGDPSLAESLGSVTRLSFGFDQAGAMVSERDRLRELAAECGDIMPSAAAITAQAVANTKELSR